MIPPHILTELKRIVGPGYLITERDELLTYATDSTKLEFLPDAVVFPGTQEEISEILILANKRGFPVTPRGAGSGASGGALPVRGGLVLAMGRFNRIVSIDPDNLIARVEPGVITAHIQEEVEKQGLFYPPDPASIHVSTIGGNVAECAGGLRAVKYGVTRDYVLGLTVVLPTGEIIRTGVETTKGVVGYDLTRLIIGSEGTLAVIASIILRLIPKPATKRTMIAFFPSPSLTVQTVSLMIRSRIVPTALEFMDSLCIDCVREEFRIMIPEEARAVLLIEVDGDVIVTASEAERVREICLRSGAIHFQTASGEEESERIWEMRRNVSHAIMKLGPHKMNQDIVVPRSRIADMVSSLGELSRRYGLPIPSFGHAGDGNLHVNIMYDKDNVRETEDARSAVRELFEKVLEMGGTISGEHGIGITKVPYLEMEVSRPALELMARLKRAFDPNGILNPGKIFPPGF